MPRLLSRRFLNPVLALSGSLTLVSGAFLLFHLISHPIMTIHKVCSIIFFLACGVHLALNWKPLLKSFGKGAAGWALLAVILLSALGMAFSGVEDKYQAMERIFREAQINSMENLK